MNAYAMRGPANEKRASTIYGGRNEWENEKMTSTETKRIGNRSDIVKEVQEIIERPDLPPDARDRLRAVLDAVRNGI